MTTYGGRTQPILIAPDNGGGGGSFSTFPVRIFDQEYFGVGGVAVSIDYRFRGSAGFNQITRKEVDNTFPAVPNQPQWKENVNATPYSVRHVTFEGDGTPTLDFPALNVWRMMGPTTIFGMQRPAVGTERFISFRVNIARDADLSVILGSALMTLRWSR